MKGFGFLLTFLLIGTTAFMYLGYSSNGSTALNQAMVSIGWRNAMTLTIKRRKLKGNIDPHSKNKDHTVNLEDYRPIDPVPSSTASIKPGPIQHDTPLLPYIPEPCPPPTRAKQGELPWLDSRPP